MTDGATEARPGFLADVIVELGLASREQVEEASQLSRAGGRKLSEVLLERGTLDDRALAEAVAARHGLPLVDLDSFPVEPDAGQLVGRSTARRYGVAPVGFDTDGALLLAMPDPTDSLARSDVAVATRLEVRPLIAPRSQIAALVETLPERTEPRPLDPDQNVEAAAPPGSVMWHADGGPKKRLPIRAVSASKTAPVGSNRRSAANEKRVKRLAEEVAERDAQLARLRDEVARLEAALAEKDAQLAAQERSGDDRDRAMADLG